MNPGDYSHGRNANGMYNANNYRSRRARGERNISEAPRQKLRQPEIDFDKLFALARSDVLAVMGLLFMPHDLFRWPTAMSLPV